MADRRDVIYYLGAWDDYGTLIRRTHPAEERVPTFSRSSSANLRDSDGVLRGAESGVIRPTHVVATDGNTYRTMLLEPASTNELTRSKDLTHADWSATNVTISADDGVGPDGSENMEGVVESNDVGDTAHVVSQAVTGMTADADYVLSVWARAGSREWIALVPHETGSFVNRIEAFFDLASGTTGTLTDNGTGSAVTHYIEDWTDVRDGLYRCVVVGSIGNSATAITARLYMSKGDDNRLYAGNGSSGVFAGHIQFEDDTPIRAATSFIETTDSTSSRSADKFSVSPGPYRKDAVQAFYLSFVAGTLLGNAGSPVRILEHGDGSNPLLRVFQESSTAGQIKVDFVDTDGNASDKTADVGTSAPLQHIEVVYAFDPADGNHRLLARADGGAVVDGGTGAPNNWTTPSSLGSSNQIVYNETGVLNGSSLGRNFYRRHLGVLGPSLDNDPLTGTASAVMDEMAALATLND